MARRAASTSVTSSTNASAFSPRARMALAAASISALVRAASVTCAPASASADAAARPMPRPPPVTSARLPSRRKEGVFGKFIANSCCRLSEGRQRSHSPTQAVAQIAETGEGQISNHQAARYCPSPLKLQTVAPMIPDEVSLVAEYQLSLSQSQTNIVLCHFDLKHVRVFGRPQEDIQPGAYDVR